MSRAIRLLYVTSSRCVPLAEPHGLRPRAAKPEDPPPPDRQDLARHRAHDPHLRFHDWMARDGSYVERVRDADEIVVPEPGFWCPLAPSMLILCLSGWYVSPKARTEGGEPAPMPSAMDAVRRWLNEQMRVYGLGTHALTGSWDYGHPAWAGDALEWLVRVMRGERAPSRASTSYESMGPRLLSVQDRREALVRLGYDGLDNEPNGVWRITDQQALVSLQDRFCLERTGYWDHPTLLAVREALMVGQTSGPERLPATAAQPDR